MKSGITLRLFLLFALAFTACSEQVATPIDHSIEEEMPPDTLRNVKLLALGDSYTIGERVAIEDRWPNLLGEKLASERILVDSIQIIARTGWTTGNLISAIDTRDPKANQNLVGLLIGVNNQYQGIPFSTYETQFEQLLNTAIQLAGGNANHVFVISIPDYGYTPFGASNQARISGEIDAYNVTGRRISLDYGVAFFDITQISREGLDRPELVAIDGLHPSGEQYREWVDLIFQSVGALLRD